MTDTSTPSPVTPMSPATPAGPNANDVLVLLTYIFPIVFIYTMMKKSDSQFHVFHSKNAAGYLVFAIALNVILQILAQVLPFLVDILLPLISLANLLIWLAYIYFGAFHAWKGEMKEIPVISMIGSKLPIEKWFAKNTGAPENTVLTSSPTSEATAAQATTLEPATVTPSTAAPTTDLPASPTETPVAQTEPVEPTPPTAAPAAPVAPGEPSPPIPPPTMPQA